MQKVKTNVYFLNRNLEIQLPIDAEDVSSDCEIAAVIANNAINTFLRDNNLMCDIITVDRNNVKHMCKTLTTFKPVFEYDKDNDCVIIKATNIEIRAGIKKEVSRGGVIIDNGFVMRIPEETTFADFITVRNNFIRTHVVGNIDDIDIEKWFVDMLKIMIR